MNEATTELGVTIEDVYRARETIRPHVHLTPTLTATALGELAGVRLFVKAEMLQRTGSFKPRGSLCAVNALAPEQRARGIITISAGNHGQGLAYAARTAGVRCTVVVPDTATRSKVDAMRGYGAEVIEVPWPELVDRAHAVEAERGLHFVHPFADPHLVAGYGTLALEVLEAVPDLDAIVVPTGGGGLLCGVGLTVKTLRPQVKVIGVEPEGAPGVWRSLREGRAVRLDSVNTIADGLAPPFADELNLRIIRRHVDQVMLVSDEEIKAALRHVLTRTKLVAEPSAAASVAALLSGRTQVQPGQTVVCILSGGNVDLARLREIL